MFAQLPEDVQKEVLGYLMNDNFPAAKRCHDEWVHNHRRNQNVQNRPVLLRDDNLPQEA